MIYERTVEFLDGLIGKKVVTTTRIGGHVAGTITEWVMWNRNGDYEVQMRVTYDGGYAWKDPTEVELMPACGEKLFEEYRRLRNANGRMALQEWSRLSRDGQKTWNALAQLCEESSPSTWGED